MRLSKHQKGILISIVLYIVATIALNALFYYYGHWEWERVWTNTLGMLIGAVGFGVFSSSVPGSRKRETKTKNKLTV